MTLIKLTQTPIIDYAGIEGISEMVDKRITALNLDNQVATEQTVKSLKQIRATLNKEFKEYEEQRKVIKNAIAKPYQEFEAQYKSLIAIKFQDAERKLKDKIFTVEDDLKEQRKSELTAYFGELCLSKDIEWLLFKDAGLNVTLSASMKSLKEQINNFVEGIEKDLQTINVIPEDEEFRAEVVAEYKVSKDVTHSIEIIQTRRKAKEEELAKREAEAKARVEREQQAQAVAEQKKAEQPQVAEPLKAPKVEQIEEVFEASFTVKGTMAQLKALKTFILENNIEILK